MARDTWVSKTACPICGGRVHVTEIDEDHGDVRYYCMSTGCAYRGVEEGPDY
jgi:hypothetical protein